MTTYTTERLAKLEQLDEIEAMLEECYGLQDLEGHKFLTKRQAEYVRSLTGPALRLFREWRDRWGERIPSDAVDPRCDKGCIEHLHTEDMEPIWQHPDGSLHVGERCIDTDGCTPADARPEPE